MTEGYVLDKKINVSEEETVAELFNSDENLGELEEQHVEQSEEQPLTESEEPRKKTNKLNNVVGWSSSDYAQL